MGFRPALSIRTSSRADRTLIVVRGALAADRAAELKAAIEAAAPASGRAVLDLSQVPALGSAAFAVLVNLALRATDAGGELVLAGLSGAPRVMVEALGLAELFTTAETVDEALKRP